ncbi:hypothetical protein J2S45_000392 [Trueperella abortisuis]|uniref:Uncharacterized protein n=1 Tax=Trueperella abortisuis TaxID=445930 RepID=A0ABT9PG69_9ACTO|nr:hypothetical protein [Trueperella abortisuis]
MPYLIGTLVSSLTAHAASSLTSVERISQLSKSLTNTSRQSASD